ncbi:MAG TPA: methyltransferase domain-containing protein [Thermoanaerobaculia bacterium]|jgi:predicted SAM-dependent methyltransferase|nr:methyltransferase domain-containing protein [Thermoanaerobaculia bacterium]
MKTKLHVGSGPVLLEGWINVDNQPYRGIDRVLDIREGIPYSDLEFIFAEHFIEHLAYDDAMKFLRDCRRALVDDGVLRLTTPNLDWVWMTQYHPGQWTQTSEAVRDCFWMNKAFRGWGHQFLYNAQTLAECLHDAGFATIERCNYGESRHDTLRGVEHHEKYLDSPELPHLIVVEATGRRRGKSEILEGPRDEFRAAVSVV